MKERKIPTKNYVIYGIIVLVTLVVVFYANEWYKAYKNSELQNSYISKYVTEINYDEFENYIQENPNSIIYISETNLEPSIKIEKTFYKLIKDNDLINNVVFLNVTGKDNILNNIQDKYYSKTLSINLNQVPAIAIFNEAKIVDIIVSNEENEISKSDMIRLLEGQGYIK